MGRKRGRFLAKSAPFLPKTDRFLANILAILQFLGAKIFCMAIDTNPIVHRQARWHIGKYFTAPLLEA
ncbi:MAG: hypothetical protein MPJ24_05685 [Pirellulaceae bacterium]|nr:hypothetical protein [Pirellulaceae bacterium]